jgi:hypothetical protein
MSSGHVVAGSAVKIVDHGPDSARWNMVILPEGYTASELGKFHDDAQRFVDHLYATAPFTDLWCGVNIHRLDVVSTSSGADYPATCADDQPGDGVPTSITVDTFFDASFCRSNTRRLLSGDEALALTTATQATPNPQVTMVIVNSSRYGGAGGGVAWFSTDTRSAEIGVHEMGHTFFHLADEYGDRDAQWAGGEAGTKANTTTITNRATTKWHDLIAASTPLPTQPNPDCSTENNAASPVAAGVVGLFEGGSRAHCGIYHPEFDCKMRHLSRPFCSVCVRKIRADLAPFVPPTTIALTTPSINFGDVPEGLGGVGVTTYRPAIFEVGGCGPVHLQIIAGPTGAFGTPLGTTVTVVPDEYGPLAHGRVWVSYTSTTAGSASNGTMTVRDNETGQTWTITISARTIARPKAAVALVLDRSGSMSEDSGDGTPKVDKLRQAVSTFTALMLPGDGLGIVRFDDTVQRLLDVTDVGPTSPVAPASGRDRAQQIVAGNDLDPAGDTSIGGGVNEGKATLDSAPATTPPWAVRAMLVVTDGKENTPPKLATISSITANTFAIGIGLPSNISTDALNALTLNHHGYLLVTGAITTEASFRLTKYFLQVLAGVSNAGIVVDPDGRLPFGAEHRIAFTICDADMGFDAIVLCEAPSLLDFQLEAPDGTLVDPGVAGVEPTIEYVVDSHVSFYRVALPALPGDPAGTRAGTWQIVLRLIDRGQVDKRLLNVVGRRGEGGLPYSALVHCYSNLLFDASLSQSTTEPGGEATVRATLREYDVALGGGASVWAEVTDPAGAMSPIALPQTGAGRFEGRFATTLPGVYVARVRASGSDSHGNRFTREQTLTAAVWRDDGGGGQGDPGWDPCALLRCLTGKRVLGERAVAALREAGIDVDELRRCLERSCR